MGTGHRFTVSLPLISLVLGDQASEQDQQILFDEMDRNMQRNNSPYAMIIAPALTRNPPMWVLQRQGQWIKQHKERLAELCLGVAFMFSSPTYRLMLGTIFLVQPLPMPYTVTGSLDDAEAWMNERLRARGVGPIRLPRDLVTPLAAVS